METLNLPFEEACWRWSVAWLQRMQMAHMERHGHPQDWGATDDNIRLAQIFEQLKNEARNG